MQTAHALTLTDAVNRTLTSNPLLHEFSFQQKRLQAQRLQTEQSPGYELEAELEDLRDNNEEGSITIALSSVFELSGKPAKRVAKADAQLQQLALDNQVRTLTVLSNLTSVFINILTLQEQLNIQKESFQLTEALINAAKKRQEKGAASTVDVLRAGALQAQARIRIDATKQAIQRQRIALAQFWGSTDTDFGSLKGDLFALNSPQDWQALHKRLKQSPAFLALRHQLRIKDADVQLAQAESTADIRWTVGVTAPLESDSPGLMLGVSTPLFSRVRNRPALDSAMAARNLSEQQQQQQWLALYQTLFVAHSRHSESVSTAQQLSTQIIPKLQTALNITQKSYQQGRLTYQDWVTAQKELLSAKQQRIDAASIALINQAVIEKITANTPAHNTENVPLNESLSTSNRSTYKTELPTLH